MSSDKKVIIVGNSTTILSEEYGDVIDSYDVVIRINKCATKGFEKHTGSKTDIWASTHHKYYPDFLPTDYKNIKEIWRRTPSVKMILPEDFPEYNNLIMFKTKDFKFKSVISGLSHEPCTGLLAILTSTLFYKDITIVGFTFYTESNGFVTGYYRDSELENDKTHKEDIYWKENKDSGFAGEDVAIVKQKIIGKLVEDNLIKILNTNKKEK